MEKRLVQLRREHQLAINQFNYPLAAEINSEIQELMAIMKNNPDDIASKLQFMSTQVNRVENQHKREIFLTNEMKDKIKYKYRLRYEKLRRLQKEELEKLKVEHQQALDREMNRAIPEVDHLFLRSRVFALDHQYQYAQEVYEEACELEKKVLASRVNECNSLFKRQKISLHEKHDSELELLLEKLTFALENVENRFNDKQTILKKRMHVKEFNTMGISTQEIREMRSPRCTTCRSASSAKKNSKSSSVRLRSTI